MRTIPRDVVRHYAQAPGPFLVLALLFQAPTALGLSLVGRHGASLSSVAEDAEVAMCSLWWSALPALSAGLASGVVYVAFAAAVSALVLGRPAGQPERLMPALRSTRARLSPLLGGTLLGTAMVALLLALPIIAVGYAQGCYGTGEAEGAMEALRQATTALSRSGVAKGLVWLSLALAAAYVTFAAVNWIVVPQVALVEGAGTPAWLLARSRELVRPRWPGVALVLFILLLAQGLVSAIVGLPATVAGVLLRAEWLQALGSVVGQVIAAPIGAIGTAIIYERLRERESVRPPA